MKEKHSLTEKQKKRLLGAAVAIFLLLSALAAWFIGRPMIRFADDPDSFRSWVDAHGFKGQLAYVGMVLLQVLVAIIPGEPLEIAGGYAFGALEGTLLCLLGATLGSLLVFAFVRRFGVKAAEVFFSKEKLHSLRFLQSTPKRDFWFFLIFMIPGTPKDLLCYAAGLTDIPFGLWLLICSVGRLPSIVTSTVGGDALGLQNYWYAVAVFAVTLAISGLGLLFYQKIVKHLEKRNGRRERREEKRRDGSD